MCVPDLRNNICHRGWGQNKTLVPMADFKELFQKTKDYVLDLNGRTCLSSFYIGKAKDVDLRHLQHQDEGYYQSVEIAHSDSAEIIDKAERYLIERFKNEQMPIAFDNINEGGGGNTKADKLYVSLRFTIKSIDELEDVDEDNFIFECIEL
jgi:hypothetical protein